MNEIFYLEPSEEITGVIDRIRKASADSVALVIPRGSTIAQSIVNLKLLKKAGDELEKEVSLVATDRIARNLASQIGITVYSKVSEAEAGKPKEEKKPVVEAKKPESDGNFKINSYYYNKDKDEEQEESEAEEEEAEDEETEEPEELEEKPKEREEAKPSSGSHKVFGRASDEVEPREEPAPYEEEAEEEKPEPHPDFKKRDVEERHHRASLDEPPRPSEKQEKVAPKNFGKESQGLSKKKKIIIGVITAAAVALIVLSYIFIPYATASIALKTTDQKIEKEVTIDKNANSIDEAKLTVPGKLVQVEKEESKEFNATGKKDVGTKASGTLTFSNGTLLDKTLKSGSVVTSSTGVKFTLMADVSLPKGQLVIDNNGLPAGVKAGTASGSVEASSTGDGGNLGASTTYTISGISNVTATGATSGGVTKEVNVVSADDLKKAKNELKNQILTDAKTDLSDQAKNAKVTIIDSTITNEEISSSSAKNENDEADKFTYTVKMGLYGIGFSESDVRKAATDSATKSLESGQMFVGIDKSEINYSVGDSNVNGGYIKLNVSMIGKVGQNLSSDAIKNKIKDKNVDAAKQTITAIDSVSSVNIKMFPSFLSRLPMLKNRINVEFSFSE